MRSKANKQSTFMQILLAPIKLLSKGRGFYKKSIMSCAEMVCHYDVVIGCPTVQISQIPMTYRFNSSKAIDDDDSRKLLQTVSKRNEFDMHCSQGKVTTSTMRHSRTERSYSAGIGKIGRIDEDRPCLFRENDYNEKADLYPRSRSHGLWRKVAYHK